MRWPWTREYWGLVKLSVNGLYAGTGRIRVNPKVKRKRYPIHVVVSVPYEGVKPTPEDMDRFELIEGQIEIIEETGIVFMVGCAWHDKVREWFLYAPNVDVRQTLLRELSQFKPTVKIADDPRWENYEFLISQIHQ